MDNNPELTNVPDYQKIMQTSHSAGVQGTNANHNTASWNDDVEILTPSPVVRHPSTGNLQQLHCNGNYSWSEKQTISGSANVIHGTSKASWEFQPQYSASKYGMINHSSSLLPFTDESAYFPQGYSRPVTKYIDANGVERRMIRKNITPNRRSFTEGLILHEAKDISVSSGGLRAASSQKNLFQDYSSLPSKHDISHEDSSQRYLGQNLQQALGDDQWKEIGASHMNVVKSPQEDLRSWQQQHQEELLHQHLETQALYESPTNQSYHFSGLDQGLGKLAVQDETSTRWEPVRRAADNIIKEKNMIIDKLKNRILELEEDFKASEIKLRQVLMSKEDDADIVKQKLQELQHKNAILKERLNEERSKKNLEIDDLELKLGSAEHEVQQLKEVLRNKDLSVSSIHTQLNKKAQEVDVWKEKFNEMCSSYQDMKKKLDGLQRYLDELPTVEESRVQAQQILSLREENVVLKSKTEGQEKKLSQVRKVVTARDFRIRELEGKEQELEKKLEVTHELELLRNTDGSELHSTQKELKTVSTEKERLAVDLEKAKKLLETTHLKLRQMEVTYQSELRAAQERLTLEEQTVMSLKVEMLTKENQMQKMKTAMKELGLQNQALLEQSLLVKEQVRHMELKNADGTLALQRRFMLQLSLCFSELQTLVHVCCQRAHGEDPDISALLGVKNAESEEHLKGAMGGEPFEFDDPAKTMSQWLNRLGELRKEVDKLRANICNRYAEDMGDNITCATQ